jgi:hypothetical protein
MHPVLCCSVNSWYMHSHTNCRRWPSRSWDPIACSDNCVLLLKDIGSPERVHIRGRTLLASLNRLLKVPLVPDTFDLIAARSCDRMDWRSDRNIGHILSSLKLLRSETSNSCWSTRRSVLSQPRIVIKEHGSRLNGIDVFLPREYSLRKRVGKTSSLSHEKGTIITGHVVRLYRCCLYCAVVLGENIFLYILIVFFIEMRVLLRFISLNDFI